MKEKNALLSKVQQSRNLPTLPHILLKLIELCNQEKAGIRDLTEIIYKDPVLSEKVLRLVNSAYYSLNQKVSSIDQAMVLLGMDAVKNMAISASIDHVFNRAQGKGFDLKLFWWHSLSCAVLARSLARKIQYHSPDEAFLSGLLHDIGKVLLWVNFQKPYNKILEDSGHESGALLQAEREFGLTHSEVGGWLLDTWKLKSFIPDAIRYHHESPERILAASQLVQLVHTANSLRPMAGKGKLNLDLVQKVFNLEAGDVEELLAVTEVEVGEIAASLDIEVVGPGKSRARIAKVDARAEKRLTDLVRDIALVQSALQGLLEADSRDDVLTIMRQGLQNWFSTKEMLFLKYCKGKMVGQPLSEDQHEIIQDLTIPFNNDGTLVTASLVEGQIVDTFSQNKDRILHVYDKQLIHLLRSEGLVVLPLILDGLYLGVFVMGCTRAECAHIRSREELVWLFLNQARLALHMHHELEVQQMRIRDERLAASSAVTRRIVHEVQNPLGIINNYLSILSSKLGEEKQLQDSLLIIKEEIQRISVLLNELSNFSSPPSQEVEPVDVNRLISDIVKISQESFWKRARIRVQCILDPNLPAIRSAPNKIKQILINLIKNAAEAMGEGGSIHIETTRSETEGNIEIQVRDSGPGIPENIKTEIFEPFISGKGQEGLGLSIVYNNVKELAGSINFESSENGTSFAINLPFNRD